MGTEGAGGADSSTHLVQEAIGNGHKVSWVSGEDGGSFLGARDSKGPIAMVPDGIWGQRQSIYISLATPASPWGSLVQCCSPIP